MKKKNKTTELAKKLTESIAKGEFNFSGTYVVGSDGGLDLLIKKAAPPPPPPPVIEKPRKKFDWWVECPTSWHMAGQLRKLCYEIGLMDPIIHETVSGWIFKTSYVTIYVEGDADKIDNLVYSIKKSLS